MKKLTAPKKSFLKALRRKGRVQQLEVEKLVGKFRAKIIDERKTIQQERRKFKRKTLSQLIDG